MGVNRWDRIFLFFLVGIAVEGTVCAEAIAHDSLFPCSTGFKKIKRKDRKSVMGRQVASFFGEGIRDVFLLQRNLFHWDSFKILTLVFPFYVAMRMVDDKLHNCFYEEYHHKNKNQMPSWCPILAEWSIGLPIVLLGQYAFFSHDEDLRTTSRIFLIGMPFVIWTKDALKKLEFDACWRPWNENFSCKKRAHGGFPSGHLAEATYMAVLFGMRYGPKYALPLGALALFVSTTFLTCNRHYASQLVAGAGFGAIYALAANRLIDSKLAEKHAITFGCSVSEYGSPAVSISMKF